MYHLTLKRYIDIQPIRLIRIWRQPTILLKQARNIKKLKVIKRNRNVIFTLWEVEIDNVLLRWRQCDELDFKNGIINFKMYGGDFKQYEGKWYVLPTNNRKTLLYVDVTIDWGIPVLLRYISQRSGSCHDGTGTGAWPRRTWHRYNIEYYNAGVRFLY